MGRWFRFSRISDGQSKVWPLQLPAGITSLKAGHYKSSSAQQRIFYLPTFANKCSKL